MIRIAIAGFSHETNTFVNLPATYERFAASGILRGDEIAQRHRHAHSTLTGFLAAADRLGFEAMPLLFAQTEPCGLITRDAYDRISEELLALLREGGPWDGVLLANHGAAVADGHPDVDGELARRVRETVGPDVPVGLGFDLHANLSQATIDHTTVCVGYRQNPHLDAAQRGYECAEIIYRSIKGEVRPVQALVTPPLVVNILQQFTGAEPMASLVRDCEEVIARTAMLSATIIQGYPYADVAEMGMGFLAVHDGNAAAAREAADWLAGRAWVARAALNATDIAWAPEAAIGHAFAADRGPVVLLDVGDNIGGGSPGDSTVLLATARRVGARRFLQTLFDPQSVAACVAAGVGNKLSLDVGAKTDDRHGHPLPVTGRVRVIADGKFEDANPTHGGARYFEAGTTAVLETDDEQTLVLTSQRVGNTSIQQMYALGVRPEAYRIVVAKGVQSPRPAYEPVAAEIIPVNTPGVTSCDLTSFAYRHRRRPLYPFED